MSSPPNPAPRGPSAGTVVLAVVLSVIALLLWIQTVALLSDLSSSDAAGNAMAQGFAAIGIILLWVVLGVLAILAYAKGEMPPWAAVAALVMVPASGFATMGAFALLTQPQFAPYRWPVVVPAATSLLIIAYCFWALSPSLRRLLPAQIVSGGIWGAVLILCAAVVPMRQVRNKVLAEKQAAHDRYDAALAALPADAPLSSLTPFLATGDYVQVDQVLARIRKLDRRQADAEEMLARGDFPLRYLSQIDLNPTASLCEKARAQLRQRAAALTLPSGQSKPFLTIAQDADDAVAAMRWLIDYDCPAMPEGAAWEAMAKAYSNPTYTIYELRDIQDPKRLGYALNQDPARFSMLTPRAHLRAWLKFADDKSVRAQALEGAAKLDHRNADAIEILRKDDFEGRVLTENIGRLDLEPTPALCRAALGNLSKQFADVHRPSAEYPLSYRDLLGQLGRGEQFKALIWLASNGCDAEAELSQAETLIKAYTPWPDSGLMLGRLEMMHKK